MLEPMAVSFAKTMKFISLLTFSFSEVEECQLLPHVIEFGRNMNLQRRTAQLPLLALPTGHHFFADFRSGDQFALEKSHCQIASPIGSPRSSYAFGPDALAPTKRVA